MKRHFWLAVVLLAAALPVTVFGQIPNPGFETWVGGQPSGWWTNNIPGFAVPVTQSSSSYSGSSALQGAVVSFGGSGYPPWVQTAFPVGQRYATVSGYYRFTSVLGDSCFLFAVMYTASLQSPVGAGEIYLPAAATYQPFALTIDYFQPGQPDTCLIWAGIVGQDTVNIGSTMLLDDLSISGVSSVSGGIETPVAFALHQNFPNPFNPATTIRYDLPSSAYVTLTVSNLLGQKVATLVQGVEVAGAHEVRFDASDLPSGLYFYTLKAGEFVQTRRMSVVK